MSMTGNIGFSTMVVLVTIIDRGSHSRSLSSRMSPGGSAAWADESEATIMETTARQNFELMAGVSGAGFGTTDWLQPYSAPITDVNGYAHYNNRIPLTN